MTRRIRTREIQAMRVEAGDDQIFQAVAEAVEYLDYYRFCLACLREEVFCSCWCLEEPHIFCLAGVAAAGAEL